jgi:hypothetical protein
MNKKEAKQRTMGAMHHNSTTWTIMGRSTRIKGVGSSSKAAGTQEQALEAWQIMHPTYVPIYMYRTHPESGRQAQIDINRNWQHGDAVPGTKPARKRNRNRSKNKSKS